MEPWRHSKWVAVVVGITMTKKQAREQKSTIHLWGLRGTKSKDEEKIFSWPAILSRNSLLSPYRCSPISIGQHHIYVLISFLLLQQMPREKISWSMKVTLRLNLSVCDSTPPPESTACVPPCSRTPVRNKAFSRVPVIPRQGRTESSLVKHGRLAEEQAVKGCSKQPIKRGHSDLWLLVRIPGPAAVGTCPWLMGLLPVFKRGNNWLSLLSRKEWRHLTHLWRTEICQVIEINGSVQAAVCFHIGSGQQSSCIKRL